MCVRGGARFVIIVSVQKMQNLCDFPVRVAPQPLIVAVAMPMKSLARICWTSVDMQIQRDPECLCGRKDRAKTDWKEESQLTVKKKYKHKFLLLYPIVESFK